MELAKEMFEKYQKAPIPAKCKVNFFIIITFLVPALFGFVVTQTHPLDVPEFDAPLLTVGPSNTIQTTQGIVSLSKPKLVFYNVKNK
jgi:hypothetical protein